MLRDIIDYKNDVIGQLNLPDDTTEDVWQEKLLPYKAVPSVVTQYQIDMTIKQRRDYCDSLIERFKKKNMSDGINALQALWMHHRLRELSIVFYGVIMKIDLMNMVVSGDVEIGCIALQLCPPDDMTMPFHWLSRERIDWLIYDMKLFLGWT